MEMDHMVTVTMLPDALALAGIGCVWLKATYQHWAGVD